MKFIHETNHIYFVKPKRKRVKPKPELLFLKINLKLYVCV